MPQRIDVPGMGVVEFPDGMSDEQIVAAIKSNAQPSPASDFFKSMPRGAVQEISQAGVGAALSDPGYMMGQIVGQKPLYDGASPSQAADAVTQATESKITGPLHQPQTPAGHVGAAIGGGLANPVNYVGPGGMGLKVGGAILSSGGSEAAGQLAKGSPLETPARFAGALAGGIVPLAARRVVTPLPTSPERAAAATTLRNEGVTDITAGQVTGRKGLQYLEAERGAGARLSENSGEQFTAAALRRVGENQATRATPEVIDRNFNRIGHQFDALAARNTAIIDHQFVTDLRTVADDYRNLVSQPNQVPAVQNYIREISNVNAQTGGSIPGSTYQSLRSRMEATARGMGNPEARNAIRGLREALDDAMERSIAANGNHADLGAWRDARNEYRNMLVIEKAATGAGEGAAVGIISPAKLREATVSAHGRRNYARGHGDFADLSRSGVAIMSPLPNSGTPGRTAAQNLGAGTSSVVGALLGGGAGTAVLPGVGSGVGGAVGALAGAAAPRLVGRAATSALGRRYLGNQVMGPPERLSGSAAIIRALLNAQ